MAVQPDDHTTVGAVNTQVGGPQYFNYTDRLDRTYFSGTPSDPLGRRHVYRGAFPMSGLNVTGTGVHAGASSPNPEVCGNLTINTSSNAETNDIDVQNWENMMLSNIGINGGLSSEQLFNHTHSVAADNGTDAVTSGVGSAATFTNLPLYDIGVNPIVDAYITMGGRERFSKRKGRYFNLVQPLESHTNVPPTGINVISLSISTRRTPTQWNL